MKEHNKKESDEQIRSIALMMGRAFADYPLIRYLFPDGKSYTRKTLNYFSGLLQYGRIYGEIFMTSPDIEGALVVLPGSAADFSLTKIIRSGLLWKFLKLGPGVLRRLFHDNNVQQQLYKKHMENRPHLYIMTLAVDPEHQGKKYAKNLISQAIENNREIYNFYYLETYIEKNVHLYRKLGFKLLEEKEIPETNLKIRALLKEISNNNPGISHQSVK